MSPLAHPAAAPVAPPAFTVGFDGPTATLRVTMAGFWTLATHDAYVAEVRQLTRPLRAQGKWFAILVDNTRFVVQSTDVSAALTRTIERGDPARRPPTALVVHGALSRLQAERIGAADHVRVFTDFATASAWLAAQRPRAAA